MTRRLPARAVLDAILDRCEPDGDCLLWRGYVNSAGYPVGRIGGQRYAIRRLVLGLASGRALGHGEVTASLCRNPLCCEPRHLRRSTHGEVLAASYAAGRCSRHLVVLPLRRAMIEKGRTKLTMEAAREIRAAAGTASARELAQRYGVSKSAIRDVLRGHTWREAASNSSVFAWRGAA